MCAIVSIVQSKRYLHSKVHPCSYKRSMLPGYPRHKSCSYLSKIMCNTSVIAEMSFLLVLHLLLHLGNCVLAKQSRLEETIKDDLKKAIFKNEKLNKVTEKEEELMQRMERTDISWKMEKEHLENELETKNVEVENLQQQLKEMKVQFAEIESRVEDIATFKSEMRAEVRKELDKVLPTVVEQGLRI